MLFLFFRELQTFSLLPTQENEYLFYTVLVISIRNLWKLFFLTSFGKFGDFLELIEKIVPESDSKFVSQKVSNIVHAFQSLDWEYNRFENMYAKNWFTCSLIHSTKSNKNETQDENFNFRPSKLVHLIQLKTKMQAVSFLEIQIEAYRNEWNNRSFVFHHKNLSNYIELRYSWLSLDTIQIIIFHFTTIFVGNYHSFM